MDELEEARVQRILDLILRLAAGDLTARETPSYAHDELDAIIVGLNMLAEELARREEQLRVQAEARQQASRLEALGTFAAGIAHDFNNILAAILAHAEVGRHQLAGEHAVSTHLEEVVASTRRASALVGQILSFTRRGRAELKPLDLVDTVVEGLRIVRPTLPTAVRLRLSLPGGQAWVQGDPTQLAQVLLNLCTNASQAMPEARGVIDVSLARAIDDQREPRWVLQVRDDGEGIDPDVREPIFDPFFTTKERGSGTGLGLAVVFGIVQAHGATIDVESEPGAGTAMTIDFPALEPPDPPGRKAPAPAEPGPSEGAPHASVLLVDDEAAIRHSYGAYLRHLGHEITTCVDGREALEQLERDAARFGVVITDETMPRMTGRELARVVAERWPDLPLVLLSGYAAGLDRADEAPGVRRFRRKPIEPAELGRVVAGLVAESRE